ncbi:efflux RND transporter permease subunit [uncultured Paludibaculum sp.]|uniref:efflux RND transporter permease subunit n=1 Tax=uncultured Paludibaculum sp. TaxID=1765020 RepID=UPI002AAB27F0|nr:efflux RND transporter permease subunit [uncultured Paludibaculum sp.]
MSKFAILNPHFILVLCLIIAVVGVVSLTRMPVDMFPVMNIPVVVVATFYNGMAPQQIEADITSRFERFFTLGSGVEHIESRSLPGVSVIKVYFQPGFNADSAVTTISNLAMAQLRRLPPGTLPPVVLKFDASSLPVCLVTLKGEGLTETKLRDLAQFTVRNQLARVSGASVPVPFGGAYRQIMVYVDPSKLEAYQLSPMDIVRRVNNANLILPGGDVQIGDRDYNVYTNSQLDQISEINDLPIKTRGQALVRISDVGVAKDANQIQTNVVRIDGQRSVYLPVLKQGGDTNTIAVVDGVREQVASLQNVPTQLESKVVFDQSDFVKKAVETLLHEGALGLFLTSVLILAFLGSLRATVAVFFSVPLSALATFVALYFGGGSINTMVLGGLALAFSRLIDNSVVVLENIYRHLELGELPAVAAEKGGREVAMPVLAATITTAVVFFPVTFLFGVSKFLFSALALAVVLALAASYVVALTVVPLFAAMFLKRAPEPHSAAGPHQQAKGFNAWFNRGFDRLLNAYEQLVAGFLRRPAISLVIFGVLFAASFIAFPFIGVSFFPRTDAGQFVVLVKAASGTRLGVTEQLVARLENTIRKVIGTDDLDMIVSNIGTVPGFSSIYTSNSAMHTAFVQVNLKEGHRTSSFEYMSKLKSRVQEDLPQLSVFFQPGGMVDAVLNLGLPAPIDVKVSGFNLEETFQVANQLANRIRRVPNVGEVYIPQDIDYPALMLNVSRARSAQLGLDQKEVVQNIITALNSNQMIAPSYWIDPKNGNDYMLTVQYPERHMKTVDELKAIPLRGDSGAEATRLDAITSISNLSAPTEVDHYQLQRVIDVYVRPEGEDLGRITSAIDDITQSLQLPGSISVSIQGMVKNMRSSFRSFGIGLSMSLVLLYLVLIAQFRSFIDPAIILIAVPPGVMGAMAVLLSTGTTINIMSLMGVIMLAGIAVSNSILIVEFARHLRSDGMPVKQAVVLSCRVRLRPVLMTSLATIIGLLPMALKLGTGSEAYAPLARTIIGGLAVSVALTVFLVPAAYYLVHHKEDAIAPAVPETAN